MTVTRWHKWVSRWHRLVWPWLGGISEYQISQTVSYCCNYEGKNSCSCPNSRTYPYLANFLLPSIICQNKNCGYKPILIRISTFSFLYESAHSDGLSRGELASAPKRYTETHPPVAWCSHSTMPRGLEKKVFFSLYRVEMVICTSLFFVWAHVLKVFGCQGRH